MGKLRLRVLTVPVLDPVTYQKHTAYCIVAQTGEHIQHAPGWTLRDAVDIFCDWYKVNRDQIILERPFLPQRALSDGECGQ